MSVQARRLAALVPVQEAFDFVAQVPPAALEIVDHLLVGMIQQHWDRPGGRC